MEDANGDYILDEKDLQVSGNSQPLITGGLNNTIAYKNLSLNVFATFTAKRSILNNALAERLSLLNSPFGTKAVVPVDDLNMWTKNGDQATYANAFDYAHNRFTNPFRYDQSLWQEEGSYLKINQITLSYTLQKPLVKRLGLSNVRTFVSASNLTTFSTYSGPNPENVSALGRDGSGGYPVPRTYNFGFNIEF
jgi:hypothetical protein